MTLLYVPQIPGMVVDLRKSWSFSGSEGSEIPLESGTGSRRPVLMAALLTGGLRAAVGDVVRHPP